MTIAKRIKAAARILTQRNFRSTSDRVSAEKGFEIVTSSRFRRHYGLMAGILASADRHMSKYPLGKLRELCRLYDRNSSLFSGILDRALDNIWGSNFDFIPNTGDKGLNKDVKEYLLERMKPENCDASGVMDFIEMSKTAMRAVWNDGDHLLAQRADGSVLAFEADQIVTPMEKNNRRIVQGVELNDVNRPVAYYIKQRQTKGDTGSVKTDSPTKRLSAQYAIVPAYRKRTAQTRGLPFLASILGIFDRTFNYLDYESIAAELNAMLGWKITREKIPAVKPGVIDNTGKSSDLFEKLQKAEPGMIFDLMSGEDVEMIANNRPGDNFEPYVVACIRLIGVGVGFPLELILLDFSKTNYSSARAALAEGRRMFRGWQGFGQKKMALPWARWQLSRAVVDNILPARPEIFKVRCQWPAWEYIDPMKEAKGNAIACALNMKSISKCIRETGEDPDETFDEIAEERKKLKERDIPITNPEIKITTSSGPEGD